MARLNRAPDSVYTHEGAVAQRGSPLHALRRSALSCMLWEREFYEDGEEIAGRIVRLVGDVCAEGAAQVAIDARERMHLRHVPLLICVALVKHGHGTVARSTLYRVIQRADELAEVLAIFAQVNGRDISKLKPLPAALKKGAADAFAKFDEYQLAKYDRAGAIRLRDVLFLCHPKPETTNQADLWRRLVDGKLAVPSTWEVEQSSGDGAKSEDEKRDRWIRLISEEKLGTMAMLRNLRNMDQAGVPNSTIEDALDRANVRRVLPFRFIAAARHVPALEPAIERALMRKLDEESSKLGGPTIVLVDHSGSMTAPVSAKSDMTRFDAACGVAMLLRERCERVRVMAFSDYLAEVAPRRGFALRDAITQAGRFHVTMLGASVDKCNEVGYDRLIVVTDEQSHDRVPAPIDGSKAYMMNVASYQHGVGHGLWTRISGWSEALVDYIVAAEG